VRAAALFFPSSPKKATLKEGELFESCPRRGGAGARKRAPLVFKRNYNRKNKKSSVWQGACANGCHKFISRIWWIVLHETND
jgi:hypothetical protein